MSGLFADDDAMREGIRQNLRGSRATQFETRRAREDTAQSLPSAIHAGTAGQQMGLDVYRQTMPEEMRTYQQGNVDAQQALIGGMGMYDAAIRGQPVDYSSMEPTKIDYDTSFTQQNLPESITKPDYLRILAQDQPINPFMDEHYTTEMLRRRNEEKRRI